MQSHSRLGRLGRFPDIAHMIFEAGRLICKTAPINTVRAELSLFWAIGAAGFCYGFHGSARSDGRVRNLRDAQLPRTVRQEPCRAGPALSPRKTMMGLCLLELQRGLQIGFSDHDGDGDTCQARSVIRQAQVDRPRQCKPQVLPMDGLCTRQGNY